MSLRRILSAARAAPFAHRAVVAGCLLAAGTAWLPCAAAPPPPPGEYIGEQGSGLLEVSRDAPRRLSFSIDTRGANGHLCGLRGTIAGDRVDVADAEPDRPCRIAFTSAHGTVRISVLTFESCRRFCGMRAGFEGVYERPTADCRTDRRLRRNDAFTAAYRARRYAAALAHLHPVLLRCDRWVDGRERGRMINDVAVTQFHLGREVACLKTLEPLRVEAEMDDHDLAERYAGTPADRDDAMRIAGWTRTNLSLCGSRRGNAASSPG